MMTNVIPTNVIPTNVISINAEGLSKYYGSVEALKDVSFSAEAPGILGILGPNGAGKTTLLRILSGFHAPSRGRVSIDGLSVEENCREVKERIGYLPENNPLYGDMSPLEYLGFIAGVHGIPKEKKKTALESVIAACGLEAYQNKRIDTLSKGYRQRTGLAAALVHDPPVLILDEPASGLDPNQIVEMRSLIRELGRRKTLILSTHILHEAEALCSRVLILNEGRAEAFGTLSDIAGVLGSGQTDLSLEELFVRLTNRESL